MTRKHKKLNATDFIYEYLCKHCSPRVNFGFFFDLYIISMLLNSQTCDMGSIVRKLFGCQSVRHSPAYCHWIPEVQGNPVQRLLSQSIKGMITSSKRRIQIFLWFFRLEHDPCCTGTNYQYYHGKKKTRHNHQQQYCKGCCRGVRNQFNNLVTQSDKQKRFQWISWYSTKALRTAADEIFHHTSYYPICCFSENTSWRDGCE